MTYRFKAQFDKATKRLAQSNRLQVADAVDHIRAFFDERQLPHGLGLTKLFSHQTLGAVFEARASQGIRILLAVQSGIVTFLMVGDHDDVRRFIRSVQ